MGSHMLYSFSISVTCKTILRIEKEVDIATVFRIKSIERTTDFCKQFTGSSTDQQSIHSMFGV